MSWKIPNSDDFERLFGYVDSTYNYGDDEWDNQTDAGDDVGSKIAGVYNKWTDGVLRNHPNFGETGIYAVPSGSMSSDGNQRDFSDKFVASITPQEFGQGIKVIDFDQTGVNNFVASVRSGFSVRLMRYLTPTEIDDPNITDGTLELDAYTGNDGKTYDGVVVGEQMWLQHSLKESEWADGSVIPLAKNSTDWDTYSSNSEGVRANINYNSSNLDEYGYFYNYFALSLLVNPAEQDSVVANTLGYSLLASSANVEGELVDMGIFDSLEVYFRYGETTSMVNQSTKYVFNVPEKSFTEFSTEPNTTYYYQFVVEDGVGNVVAEGAMESFTTAQVETPLWKIPTDYEYKKLERYLGMTIDESNDTEWRGTNEGSKLAGNESLWDSGDLTDDSEFGSSGFDLLPGGYRHTSGSMYNIGSFGRWWSSSDAGGGDAWYRLLYDSSSSVFRYSHAQAGGYSVRLFRDTTTEEDSDPDGTVYTDDYTGNDGKKYDAVKIGSQVWINENLAETKYYDGTSIPEITDDTDWENDTTGARCAYDNDSSNADTYGYLYNWYAVDSTRSIINNPIRPSAINFHYTYLDDTSITVEGEVGQDGGYDCDVLVLVLNNNTGQYQISSSSGYRTGDTFTMTVSGLDPETTYYAFAYVRYYIGDIRYNSNIGDENFEFSTSSTPISTIDKEYSFDTYLTVGTSDLDKNYTFDTYLEIESYESDINYSFDTSTYYQLDSEYTFDSVLSEELSKNYTFDSLLRYVIDKDYTFDTLTYKEESLQYSFDTFIVRQSEVEYYFDTNLKKAIDKEYYFEAVLYSGPDTRPVGTIREDSPKVEIKKDTINSRIDSSGKPKLKIK